MSTIEETTTQEAPSKSDAAKSAATVVDALFDLGTAWADAGIGYGKLALQTTARALGETAKALEVIQQRLRGDEAPKTG